MDTCRFCGSYNAQTMFRLQWRYVKSLFARRVPDSVKPTIVRLYNRTQERRADRQFDPPRQSDAAASDEAPRHVVFVVVDALRADVVSPDATPTIAGLDPTSAVAPASWTFPSVCSLLTGLRPHEHGAMRQSDDVTNATEEELTVPPALNEEVSTLPELLSCAGYDTFGAFGFQMPFLAGKGRFATHRLFGNAPAPDVFDAYADWLNKRKAARTFAYLHLSDLHEPVKPPVEYRERHEVDESLPDLARWDYTELEDHPAAERYREHRRRLYRAAVAYVDDCLGEFLDRLRSQVSDPTFVVTADHGEALWEFADFDAQHFVDSRPAYCVGHGGTPYESIARVPLAATNLSFEAGPASLVDVTPTLLGDVRLDPPESTAGYDHGESVPADRIRMIEAARYGYEKKAAYRDNWKLLVSRGDDAELGFELPGEEPVDLPASVVRDLRRVLPEWPEDGDARRVSGTVQRRLENLGYK